MTRKAPSVEHPPAVLDEEQLEEWGARLGPAAARWGGMVALRGPLGSGKTTLVRAAARACGIEGPVQSPTYTLVHEHRLPAGGTFFHVDLYRIDDPEELAELGWERIRTASGPVFVEWAGRAGQGLPPARWEVALEMADAGERRRVRVRALGGAPAPPAPAPAPGTGERER